MSLNKIVYTEGVGKVNGGDIKITISHKSDEEPQELHFTFKPDDKIVIYGMCDRNKILTYNVSGGIIDKETIEKVEVECVDILSSL